MVTMLHWIFPQWFPAIGELSPAIAGLIIFLELGLCWSCRPRKETNKTC